MKDVFEEDDELFFNDKRCKTNNGIYHTLLSKDNNGKFYKKNKKCRVEHINMIRDIEEKKKVDDWLSQ